MANASWGRELAAGGGAGENLCGLALTSSSHTSTGQGHLAAPGEQHMPW